MGGKSGYIVPIRGNVLEIKSKKFDDENRGALKEILDNYILQGGDINSRNSDGESVIWEAVKNNDIMQVELLLDAGAKVDFLNKKRESIIWRAVKDNDIVWLKLLLDAGAKVNLQNKNGEFLISKVSSKEVLTLLFKLGVNFSKNLDLMWNFIYNNALNFDKNFIALNAVDLHCVDVQGTSPILTKLQSIFLNKELFGPANIDELLKFYDGFNVDLTLSDSHGCTLAHLLYKPFSNKLNGITAIEEFERCEKTLISLGINPDKKDASDKTYHEYKKIASATLEENKRLKQERLLTRDEDVIF